MMDNSGSYCPHVQDMIMGIIKLGGSFREFSIMNKLLFRNCKMLANLWRILGLQLTLNVALLDLITDFLWRSAINLAANAEGCS
jgi:hypothetical protein